MSVRYPSEAIEHCKRLFLKFNGKQADRIEKEMHKAGWTGWRKQNLYNRGKDKKGWIETYRFDEALRIYIAQQPTAALNNAQKLVREIEWIRESLDAEVKTKGVTAVDIKLLYLHRDYCKLCIDALTRVEAARDTLGGFVAFWERFIDWITDIDGPTARKLLKFEDLIVARAEKEFSEDADNIYQREPAQMNGNESSTDAAAESGAQV